MKTVAFIPARYGSTRFPGKPLAPIAGAPMIQHVYRHAVACPEVADVFVATDDERIYDCVQGFGGQAIMTGTKHPSGTDRVAEAARELGLSGEDLVINIQGDQPAFDPAIITHLIAPMINNPKIHMGTLMNRVEDEIEISNPNYVKVVTDKHQFALLFSRSPIPFYRESGPTRTYFKHLGFYAYRADFLQEFAALPVSRLESAEKLEQLRAIENGFRILVIETRLDSIEVDTPNDIAKVEKMMIQSTPDER